VAQALLTHPRSIDKGAIAASMVAKPDIVANKLKDRVIPTGGWIKEDDISSLRSPDC
jgi:hypothetical protein